MKKNFYQYITCIAFIASGLCISSNVFAQVTVGSKGVPNAGALLDMKQKDKTDGSANSDKGLGLPRVALSAVDKLDPCVATTGNATTDDTAKKSHIGLTVYNTTDNTSTDATLIEGVYAWDGTMWTQYSGSPAGGAENGLSMNGRKVILGGSLNQPTTITGDATNDLTLETPTTIDETLTVTGNESVGGSSTIGMNTTTPTVGALLEIRNKQQDLTGVTDVLDPKMVTSDKGGLLLPRVQLVNLASLEPFITGADAETKLSLAGLMVYNIAVSGDKIYPAFYIWSGTSWETSQQSASQLIIDNSVEARVKPFTFYELDTETTTSTPVKFEPLKVTVSGAFGTPTYQWYQVTGTNIHVRTGSKIIGATSDTFYPVDGTEFNADGDITASVSVLKGTTRNANNTGFYKYYCVVSDAYRTVETETVEVAVGCGAKNNNGDWISFMCFNLGAGKSLGTTSYSGVTIKEQRETTLPSYYYTNAAGTAISSAYVAGQEILWGDLFQAGRIADGHQSRVSATIPYSSVTTAMIGDGGQCTTNSNTFPRSQVIKTSSAVNKFIIGNSAWNPVVTSSIWSLAGNDPCTKYQTNGSYQAFWNDATGVNSSSAACKGSNTGWRLPQQEEFGSIYKTGLLQGSPAGATANTISFYRNGNSTANTKTNGLDIKPDGKTITLFIPAAGTRTAVQDGLAGPGTLFLPGFLGMYWTNESTGGTSTKSFYFNPSEVKFATSSNSNGVAIRCIKNQ